MLAELRAGPGQGTHGPLVYRIEIAPDGAVAATNAIFDRVATSGDSDLDRLRAAAEAAIRALRFPEAAGSTRANIPLIF